MHWITTLKRSFLVSTPISFLIRKSKQIYLPGFKGIALFDVIKFFFAQAQKTGFSERSAAIAFNFVMAIPPSVIFLFTLIPYMPISDAFIEQMYGLIRDVVPGEENNQRLIGFLNDILNNQRSGLLSIGFILAMFFSSNAVMGIMRSFDKNYIGFIKRKDINERWVAIKLTMLLFFVFAASIVALIMQGQVLRYLGITNTTVLGILEKFRWIVIILLFFFAISFIYRYAPAVHKRWPLISPGSLLATFLMIAFTAVFSYYVSNFSNYNELYGSISTLLILMLLIYFNSLVLLIGFELNVSINSLKHEVDERNKAMIAAQQTA